MLIFWQRVIPVKLITPNQYEHWTRRNKRTKILRTIIGHRWNIDKPNVTLPCLIKLTRIAPRKLDFDNLCSSQKFVCDVICDFVNPGLQAGRADADKRIKIRYFQEKGEPKEHAIKIEIFSISADTTEAEIREMDDH